jgi:hypothetical protein
MIRLFSLAPLAIVALIALSTPLFAQDDKLNQFSFEDVPTEDSKPPYFAISGGFTTTWLFTNLTDLNVLTNGILGSNFSSPIVLFGGQAFAAIGIIPNVRAGFFSMASAGALEGQSRRVEYGVSMTGVSVDYAFTPFKGFAVLPGVNVGWGAVNYEVSQVGVGQAFSTFPFASGTQTQANFMRRLRSNMIFVTPNLNIEYAFTIVSMIRLNVGYNLSFMGDWRVDNSSTISGVPSSINATGLTAQVGLFVGLFNN